MRPVLPAAVLVALATLAGDARAGTAVPAAGAPVPAIVPYGDLRVRQEILDGVFHFAPDPDRDWIRVRTRAGLRATARRHTGELRLANEHRHYLEPEQAFDGDELIVDRAVWSWRGPGEVRLSVGRQDIVWPGGFLVLEGHPLDGSRSIYQNAVRLQTARTWGDLDLALIRNLQRDRLVLAGDTARALTDMDETGAALRAVRGPWQWSVVLKAEHDPDGQLADLTTVTLGARFAGQVRLPARLEAEGAVQHQDGSLPTVAGERGWAVALQAFLSGPLGRGVQAEGGFFYYGGGGARRPFRTPWGRWPKWSELYLYTLIGESPPGRVNVAAWENIAAPRLTLTGAPGRGVTARLGAAWLLAPEPVLLARGLLVQSEVTVDLGTGLAGHLLWETLRPGPFHDGRGGLPPLTAAVHFLRWQFTISI